MDNRMNVIWIFNGSKSQFSSGAFTELQKAELWIKKHGLSGVLTAYPLDTGAYDWAIEKGFFKPKRENQCDAEFIQCFSTAALTHYHYEKGEKE